MKNISNKNTRGLSLYFNRIEDEKITSQSLDEINAQTSQDPHQNEQKFTLKNPELNQDGDYENLKSGHDTSNTYNHDLNSSWSSNSRSFTNSSLLGHKGSDDNLESYFGHNSPVKFYDSEMGNFSSQDIEAYFLKNLPEISVDSNIKPSSLSTKKPPSAPLTHKNLQEMHNEGTKQDNTESLKAKIYQQVNNSSFDEAFDSFEELISIKTTKLHRPESRVDMLRKRVSIGKDGDSDLIVKANQVSLFKEIQGLLSATNALHKILEDDSHNSISGKINTARHATIFSDQEDDMIHALYPDSLKDISGKSAKTDSVNITQFSESFFHPLSLTSLRKNSQDTSETYRSSALDQRTSRTSMSEEIKTARGMVANAQETVINTLDLATKSSTVDPYMLQSLADTVVNLTKQLESLKHQLEIKTEQLESKVTELESSAEMTEELNAKVSELANSVAPTIKNLNAQFEHERDLGLIRANQKLSDYHSGFLKILDQYFIGAFAKNSNLVNKSYDHGFLDFLGDIIPGANTFIKPIDAVVTVARDVKETNEVTSTINSAPNFLVMMQDIVPIIAAKITLNSKKMGAIDKATMNSLQEIYHFFKGTIWEDQTPNSQFALGAKDALKLIKAMQMKKINLSQEKPEDSIKIILNFFFEDEADNHKEAFHDNFDARSDAGSLSDDGNKIMVKTSKSQIKIDFTPKTSSRSDFSSTPCANNDNCWEVPSHNNVGFGHEKRATETVDTGCFMTLRCFSNLSGHIHFTNKKAEHTSPPKGPEYTASHSDEISGIKANTECLGIDEYPINS
ncbi:MAG: hypothetical protein SFT91_03880 [Rickettsiaceae bacterium]|nr:hypothetical protein [Rickettsiaceae bacterium]